MMTNATQTIMAETQIRTLMDDRALRDAALRQEAMEVLRLARREERAQEC